MREDDSGDGRVECGRDRGGGTAAHTDRCHPPPVRIDPRDEGAEGRPEMRERAVLADGCTGPERHRAGQCGQEAGARRHAAVEDVNGADDVGRTMRTALRYVAVQDADDEPAHGGHADRGEQQPPCVARHETAARRDEQPLVQNGDQLHERDCSQGCQRTGRHAENGDRYNAHDRIHAPGHRHVTSTGEPGRSRYPAEGRKNDRGAVFRAFHCVLGPTSNSARRCWRSSTAPACAGYGGQPMRQCDQACP